MPSKMRDHSFLLTGAKIADAATAAAEWHRAEAEKCDRDFKQMEFSLESMGFKIVDPDFSLGVNKTIAGVTDRWSECMTPGEIGAKKVVCRFNLLQDDFRHHTRRVEQLEKDAAVYRKLPEDYFELSRDDIDRLRLDTPDPNSLIETASEVLSRTTK